MGEWKKLLLLAAWQVAYSLLEYVLGKTKKIKSNSVVELIVESILGVVLKIMKRGKNE